LIIPCFAVEQFFSWMDRKQFRRDWRGRKVPQMLQANRRAKSCTIRKKQDKVFNGNRIYVYEGIYFSVIDPAMSIFQILFLEA
jgi:hypothetical protein